MKRKDAPMEAQRIQFPSEDYRIICMKSRFRQNDRAFHEELEIKYYVNGNSAVMIGGEVFVVNSGNLTVVNPFEIHSNGSQRITGK